jgi:hypothetical protein
VHLEEARAKGGAKRRLNVAFASLRMSSDGMKVPKRIWTRKREAGLRGLDGADLC